MIKSHIRNVFYFWQDLDQATYVTSLDSCFMNTIEKEVQLRLTRTRHGLSKMCLKIALNAVRLPKFDRLTGYRGRREDHGKSDIYNRKRTCKAQYRRSLRHH